MPCEAIAKKKPHQFGDAENASSVIFSQNFIKDLCCIKSKQQ